jgi:hypothetical protein
MNPVWLILILVVWTVLVSTKPWSVLVENRDRVDDREGTRGVDRADRSSGNASIA